MSGLTVALRAVPQGAVLELAGEIDHDTAPRVREVLQGYESAAGALLVIDLSGVSFCDSSGMTALIAARHRVLAEGAQLALSAVPARLARTFALVGLDEVFVSHPTVDQAFAAHVLARDQNPDAG